MGREVGGHWPKGLGLFSTLLIVALWLGPSSAAAATCPNEGFRVGPSAGLPDCRAYELISPPDSNGRLLEPISGFSFELTRELFPTELASPSRDSIDYETWQSPLLLPLGPNGNGDVYEAVRGVGGWETVRRLTPSGSEAVSPVPGGISSDHGFSFFHVAPIFGNRIGGSLAGELGATYLRGPDGSFKLVGIGTEGVEPLVQGRYISPGGRPRHLLHRRDRRGAKCLVRTAIRTMRNASPRAQCPPFRYGCHLRPRS